MPSLPAPAPRSLTWPRPPTEPMNASHDLIAVFGGIFGLLAVFSLIGAGLKYRVARGEPHGVIDNLNARIKAWWAMIALFALVSFQCLREYVSLAPTRKGDHRALIWSFYVFLPLQYYLIAAGWYGLFSILIPVYAFLLLPISASLGADTARFLERSAKIQWGLMICVYCLSHVPALLTLEIPDYAGRNLLLVVFLLLTVQSSDVFQYIWGKLLGRHALSKQISPSKTVEGLAGGMLSATAMGAALWWITPFSPGEAAFVALVINTLGFFGGFVLSAIKRDRGVKDWGHLIEGHGGMLDRVDSLAFSAPVFFHLLRHGWTL